MKAYWWKSPRYDNLGDELTEIILRDYFHQPVEHAPLGAADLLSAGSVLGWVTANPETTRTKPLAVVGSGFMHSHLVPEVHNFLKIYSVRGYLSRTHLPESVSGPIALGDPGILASRVATASSATSSHDLGIVLHHSNTANLQLQEKFAHLDPKFIDIRTDNLNEFVREVSSCRSILSESLHGLIIADSLGVPNAWLNMGALHPGGSFKFFDYFSTVGREFYQFVWRVPQNIDAVERALFCPEPNRIKKLQDETEVAFKRFFEDFYN